MLKRTMLALAALAAIGFASAPREASASYAGASAELARLAISDDAQLVHYGPYHCHRGYYRTRCHGFRRPYRRFRPYRRVYGGYRY